MLADSRPEVDTRIPIGHQREAGRRRFGQRRERLALRSEDYSHVDFRERLTVADIREFWYFASCLKLVDFSE